MKPKCSGSRRGVELVQQRRPETQERPDFHRQSDTRCPVLPIVVMDFEVDVQEPVQQRRNQPMRPIPSSDIRVPDGRLRVRRRGRARVCERAHACGRAPPRLHACERVRGGGEHARAGGGRVAPPTGASCGIFPSENFFS